MGWIACIISGIAINLKLQITNHMPLCVIFYLELNNKHFHLFFVKGGIAL